MRPVAPQPSNVKVGCIVIAMACACLCLIAFALGFLTGWLIQP